MQSPDNNYRVIVNLEFLPGCTIKGVAASPYMSREKAQRTIDYLMEKYGLEATMERMLLSA